MADQINLQLFHGRFAGAMDWNQRLLTFYGANPTHPSLEAVTGAPPDAGGDTLAIYIGAGR